MNKKIEERTELERTTALIANLVFGFNGSDPEVKKKQVGLKHATEIVDALIETEREEAERKVAQKIYDWLETEWYGRSELQTRIKLTYLAERGKI